MPLAIKPATRSSSGISGGARAEVDLAGTTAASDADGLDRPALSRRLRCGEDHHVTRCPLRDGPKDDSRLETCRDVVSISMVPLQLRSAV